MSIFSKKSMIPVFAVCCVLGLIVWKFSASPEAQVKKTLGKFTSCLSKGEGTGAIALAAASQNINKFFIPNSEVVIGIGKPGIDFNETFRYNDMSGSLVRFHSAFKWVKVSAEDIKVSGNSDFFAEVKFTGKLSGVLKTGEKIDDVESVNCRIQKIGNDWKIISMKVESLIEK